MTVKNTNDHKRALYIDTESTFWSGPPPPGLTHEIIEIGMVEMDLTSLKITRQSSHFIRPKRWEISERCTQLTGITADDIRPARTFPEVLSSLTDEFAPSTALCCTWGDDATLIRVACQKHGLRMPLRNLLDLAQLFQGLFVLKQMAGLHQAVSMLGLTFEGVPHGALPDARNTALVHAAVLSRIGREPDHIPTGVERSTQPPGVSSFGQKLRDALQGG